MPIRAGSWDELKTHLMPVRSSVFIIEQQVPAELEWDDDDTCARHFLATDEDGAAVGCARLLPSGQIGRMAVIAAQRRQGWGARLLVAAETCAADAGMQEVFLHAQTHAIPFYAAHGYTILSDEFMDAGIPHRTMTKCLTNSTP